MIVGLRPRCGTVHERKRCRNFELYEILIKVALPAVFKPKMTTRSNLITVQA
jgi:hypothetical protein